MIRKCSLRTGILVSGVGCVVFGPEDLELQDGCTKETEHIQFAYVCVFREQGQQHAGRVRNRWVERNLTIKFCCLYKLAGC